MGLSFLAFTALLSVIAAQDTTTTVTDFTSAEGTSPTSTSTQPITVTVAVGNGGNTFVPDVVQVSPGNYVEFDFYPLNHSVIRAAYMYPCVPYELTGPDRVGFFSGFYPVDAILSDPPKWTLLINDTDPVFYYCGAPGSCIGYQMVGVINPNASQSIQVQKQYAANSSFMLEPGQSWPAEEDPFATTSTSTSTATATYTATFTTSTSSPTPTSATPTAVASESGHSTLSSGAIAGIAIGGAAVVIAAAVLLFFCGRRSRPKDGGNQAAPSTPAMGPVSSPPAYIPPNGYGYMSPTQKHMSVTTMPGTDAFGNAIPGGGMFPYPQAFPQGGYPGHQQMPPQNPMGNPGQPQPMQPPQWPPSPSNDIFGAASPAAPTLGLYQALDAQHQPPPPPPPPAAGCGIVTETASMRASSPNSMAAPPAASAAGGGIEAFLQRQSRMSPPPENEVQQAPPQQQQQQAALPPIVTSGPYEMSATGTMHRFS